MHDLPSIGEEKRLGPSFHRTFPFNCSAVSALLSLAARYESEPEVRITKDVIKKETLLGIQYVEAMPRYAQAGGLLDSKNRLTPLGRRVAAHDVSLERRETLWMIHYHLARRDGLAPRFWGYLFEEVMHSGDSLERDRVASLIREVSQSQQDVLISDETAAAAATVFLKTYSSGESLGRLSILQDDGGGCYSVLETESPTSIVFALVVADYWAKNLRETTSAFIDEFNKVGGPAQVLLMGRGQVNHAMRELSRMGLATVQLNQPPYQFSPLWKNQDELLDRIYAPDA
jgi:hypothetical protein